MRNRVAKVKTVIYMSSKKLNFFNLTSFFVTYMPLSKCPYMMF